MNKLLAEEIERIEKLAESAWYYPGLKPSLPGNAVDDIKYLIAKLKELSSQADTTPTNDEIDEKSFSKNVAIFRQANEPKEGNGFFSYYRLLDDENAVDKKVCDAANFVVKIKFSKDHDFVSTSVLPKNDNTKK